MDLGDIRGLETYLPHLTCVKGKEAEVQEN